MNMSSVSMLPVLPCIFLFLLSGVCSYKVKEVKVDFSKQFLTFSADDLAQYDGSDPDKPLYMAVKGTVFDVSEGRQFYGKGTAYNALTGKDCSRAVAKMSLEPEDLNGNLDGLTDEQLQSLDKIYSGTYMPKYPVVGYLDYLVRTQASKPSDEL